MADTAGLVELKNNPEAAEAVCGLVALSFPTGFIKEHIEKEHGLAIDENAISKLKSPMARPAWQKLIAKKKKQILQGFVDLEPMFLPHVQALMCFQAGRHALAKGKTTHFFMAIEIVNKYILNDCAGYQLLKDYTCEQILKQTGMDKAIRGNEQVTETVDVEILIARIKKKRSILFDDMKILLEHKGDGNGSGDD